MRVAWDRSVPVPLVLLAIISYTVQANAASNLPSGRVVIDERVTIDVEVARTWQAQAKGLGGRSSLKKGTGMVFPYDAPGPRAFWMSGMLIPLDILWISGGKVVAIEARIPPPSAGQAVAVFNHVADLVLEVPAGYADEMGIRVGHSVKVTYR